MILITSKIVTLTRRKGWFSILLIRLVFTNNAVNAMTNPFTKNHGQSMHTMVQLCLVAT